MASSSKKRTYDIFLSFRGEDTRKKFTDHLYHALVHEGFQTFRDDDEIERGEVIKSELEKSIMNSTMSVLVLSKNYAKSTACLFELLLILDQYKKSAHFVLPVFYEVDPWEIKEQAKNLNFGEKVVTVEKVKAWTAALKEVASMAGMVSQNQFAGEMDSNPPPHERHDSPSSSVRPGMNSTRPRPDCETEKLRSVDSILRRLRKPEQVTTSSSTSTANTSATNRRKCLCGEEAVVQTSKTGKNPLRRFYGCRNYHLKDKGCDYFVWIDDEACEQCKVVIDNFKDDVFSLKEELLKLREDKMNLMDDNRKLVDVNRQFADKNRQLIDENMQLKEVELELRVQVVELNARVHMDDNNFAHPPINNGRGYGVFIWGLLAICIFIWSLVVAKCI